MKNNVKLKPDIVLKEYWRRNDEFADLFNAYLYGGKEVIKPDALTELDTESSGILEIEDKEVSIQSKRDIIKSSKLHKGIEYAILAVENQDYIHYSLPVIIGSYDFHTYRQQLKSIKQKHKKNKDLQQDELMSGLKATDRLVPVITLVLYYGRKSWDGPKNLHDILNIPKQLIPFVPKYSINLVEINNYNLNFKNKNNNDLFTLLNYIYNNKAKKEAVKYFKEYDKYNKPDKSVIQAIAATTGIRIPSDEEDIKMDQFWEDVKEIGKQEGISEGITQGITQGFTQGITQGEEMGLIRMICKKLKKNISIRDIADMLEEDEDRITTIVSIAQNYSPDYDVDKIYKAIKNSHRPFSIKSDN